jgi:hypothetical protein
LCPIGYRINEIKGDSKENGLNDDFDVNIAGFNILRKDIILKKMSVTPKDIDVVEVENSNPVDSDKNPFRI